MRLSYRPTASHRHALLCAGDRVQPCQPAAVRTLDVIPKSLRGVQSSDAGPYQAPKAVTPDQAQLSGDSSEWEVRVCPTTQISACICDVAPRHISRWHDFSVLPPWSGAAHSAAIQNSHSHGKDKKIPSW